MAGITGAGAMPASTGARCCGASRTAGGAYLETGLSPWGTPLEAFLMDPPVMIDPGSLGLAAVGVKVVQDTSTGVWHVLDWVGESHYESPVDFVEEVRRLGLSRRISTATADLDKLTPESRIILVHARGYILNASKYHFPMDGSEFGGCPCEKIEHKGDFLPSVTCCIGSLWDDAPGGERLRSDARTVQRRMPWGSYLAQLPPEGVKPKHHPAIFARFPIGRFAVVRDGSGNAHQKALGRLERAGHFGHLVDE